MARFVRAASGDESAWGTKHDNRVGSSAAEEAVDRPYAPRRQAPGPTIRCEADFRKCRDMLIVMMMASGYNHHDVGLVFDCSPNHAYKRVRQVGVHLGGDGTAETLRRVRRALNLQAIREQRV